MYVVLRMKRFICWAKFLKYYNSNHYLRTTENTAALLSFDRLMLSSIREYIIYVKKHRTTHFVTRE